MNPGATEEAGATIRSLVDALKAQPSVLALTVANIAMMVFIFYALQSSAAFRENLAKQNHDYQRELTQLLAKCVVPDVKP